MQLQIIKIKHLSTLAEPRMANIGKRLHIGYLDGSERERRLCPLHWDPMGHVLLLFSLRLHQRLPHVENLF
jgi:hypothetical protein